MTRLKQILDELQYRLAAIPVLQSLGAVVLAAITLTIDQELSPESWPNVLQVSVDSGRAALSALASGLISSVALLLSLTLVVVQLASSQFSPRTTRDWLGDRTQQLAIGSVLASAVYCLVVVRATREAGPASEEMVPNLSILVGLVLGVGSLIGVVVAVDELASSVRIGAVTERITKTTIQLAADCEPTSPYQRPAPPIGPELAGGEGLPIAARSAGWVQQVDVDGLLTELPEGAVATVVAPVGTYVVQDAPVVVVRLGDDDEARPAGDDGDDLVTRIRSHLAIGQARTMQQDVGFGIVRLVDIALKALSPGINDPNTADEVIVHLESILVKVWERSPADGIVTREGRTVVRPIVSHADMLHGSYDDIIHYGRGDVDVLGTVVVTLAHLRGEVIRRRLAGPVAPIDELRAQIVAQVAADRAISEPDRNRFTAYITPPVLDYPELARRPANKVAK